MEHLVDLTMTLREGMVGHASHGRTPVRLPGSMSHASFRNQSRANPYDGGQLSFANEQWVVNGNTGTHMDSVWHADPESQYTMEKMPIRCGLGPAIILQVHGVVGPGEALGAADLERSEAQSGSRIEAGDIVLLNTGSGRLVADDPDAYLTDYVALDRDAGEWLRARGVRTVGIDAPTVDAVESVPTSPVHMNFLRPRSLGLLDHDFIAIIENLTNLDAVASTRFHFTGLPLPFEGGSGSPIRAIAQW